MELAETVPIVFNVVYSLLYEPPIVCGVFVLLCIHLCLFYFCNHLAEEERSVCFALTVFLMFCDC